MIVARVRAMKPHELAAAAFRLREIGILIALVAVVIFFGVRATNFLTVGNWQGIAQNVSIVAQTVSRFGATGTVIGTVTAPGGVAPARSWAFARSRATREKN